MELLITDASSRSAGNDWMVQKNNFVMVPPISVVENNLLLHFETLERIFISSMFMCFG